MTLLAAPSKAAADLVKALNLPPRTIAFSLRMRAGEPAVLEVETYVEAAITDEVVTVLKRYRLEEIEPPTA